MTTPDPLLFSLSGPSHWVDGLAKALKMEKGQVVRRSFPDGESYLRYETPVKGRQVIFVEGLDRPDAKFLPLVFAAGTARELGANAVGLVAPYLPYMRQDKRFREGEAITSVYFAKLLSQTVDWMVTVDPHLHRYHSLSEIYTIPTCVVSASSLIASWIHETIQQPLLIGPDEESRQWVAQIADRARAPFTVLTKTRLGDHEVQVSVPLIEDFPTHVPVLVDDIVSTGQTMIETLHHLKSLGTPPPVCVIVHPLFSGITTQTLKEAGAQRVVSCNTIVHESNALDLCPVLADAVGRFV